MGFAHCIICPPSSYGIHQLFLSLSSPLRGVGKSPLLSPFGGKGRGERAGIKVGGKKGAKGGKVGGFFQHLKPFPSFCPLRGLGKKGAGGRKGKEWAYKLFFVGLMTPS